MKIIIKNDFDDTITRKLEFLSNDFKLENDLKKYQDKVVELRVPNNFNTVFYQLSNSKAKSYLLEYGFPVHNALTILPTDSNYSKFIILFRENIFNDYEYFSTVTHELCHLIDFLNYFKDNGNIYNGNATYDEFYYWTEFNAKRKGIERIMIELNKEKLSISLERASELFLEEISKNKSLKKQVYLLVHFFARLSIFDKAEDLEFDKKVFPKDKLFRVFGENLIDLYRILLVSNDYSEFKKNRLQLKQILDIITK